MTEDQWQNAIGALPGPPGDREMDIAVQLRGAGAWLSGRTTLPSEYADLIVLKGFTRIPTGGTRLNGTIAVVELAEIVAVRNDD